jgi:ADP-ribosylglycohydrolase
MSSWPLVSLHKDVRTALVEAKVANLRELNPSTFVIDTLRVAVCALLQPTSFEEILVEAVNLGGDADSNGAVAGGLLGARDGECEIPMRWLETLEFGAAFGNPHKISFRSARVLDSADCPTVNPFVTSGVVAGRDRSCSSLGRRHLTRRGSPWFFP